MFTGRARSKLSGESIYEMKIKDEIQKASKIHILKNRFTFPLFNQRLREREKATRYRRSDLRRFGR